MINDSNKICGYSKILEILEKYYKIEDTDELLKTAVLDNTYFVHRDIVAQTQNLPIYKCRRNRKGEKGDTMVDGVYVSSNFPPGYALNSAIKEKRENSSTTLCHIYSKDDEAYNDYFYTNLANLCIMPNFLSKFSDTDSITRKLLEQCSLALYEFNPYNDLSPLPKDDIDRIKTASKPSDPFFDLLMKSNSKVIKGAMDAGFIFDENSTTAPRSEWVEEYKGLPRSR